MKRKSSESKKESEKNKSTKQCKDPDDKEAKDVHPVLSNISDKAFILAEETWFTENIEGGWNEPDVTYTMNFSALKTSITHYISKKRVHWIKLTYVPEMSYPKCLRSEVMMTNGTKYTTSTGRPFVVTLHVEQPSCTTIEKLLTHDQIKDKPRLQVKLRGQIPGDEVVASIPRKNITVSNDDEWGHTAEIDMHMFKLRMKTACTERPFTPYLSTEVVHHHNEEHVDTDSDKDLGFYEMRDVLVEGIEIIADSLGTDDDDWSDSD